jgi:hypothetical protein
VPPAAILHLPGENSLRIADPVMTESQLVQARCGIHPCVRALIFGKPPLMLEKIMSIGARPGCWVIDDSTWFMVSPQVG